MIDGIRGIGSSNYDSYGAYGASATGSSSAAGSSSAVGSSGDSGCCCCHGQDSVSLSPEAMEMMMMEQQKMAAA